MNRRDRQALVLGGTVLLAAFGFTWGVRPAASAWQALRAEATQERDLLRREVDLLAELTSLERRAAELTARLGEVESDLFAAADPLDATAQLATWVSEVARRHRVHLQQGETRPVTEVAGGLTAIEVGLRASGDLEGIVGLLAELESGARAVTVPRLAIERTVGAAGDDPDRETLTLTLIVRGYTAPDVAAAEGARATWNASPAVRLAVRTAPFRASRRPAPLRYLPPGTAAPTGRPAAPAIQLTGTMVYPGGGGAALVRLGGSTAAMVRVGETVEGLTLRSVTPEEAVFARPGGGLTTLRVARAGNR